MEELKVYRTKAKWWVIYSCLVPSNNIDTYETILDYGENEINDCSLEIKLQPLK